FFETLQFISSKMAYATAEGNLFFKTTDGGTTWSNVTIPDSALLGDYVGALYFQNSQTGWIGGGDWGVLSTNKGGRNWFNLCNYYGDCFAFDGFLSSFLFLSPTIGQILNDGMVTTEVLLGPDGYNEVAGSYDAPYPLSAMQFPSAQVGYACGAYG